MMLAMNSGKRKKPSFMQRLSSWFEQLPLRRRCSQRRAEAVGPQKHSKSAAPRLHYSTSSTQQFRHRDYSVGALSRSLITSDQQNLRVPPSWICQERANQMCCDNTVQSIYANPSNNFSSSYSSGRMKIRTNPWISRERSSVRANSHNPRRPPNELLYASVGRCSSLRVKSLDESTCSSGYGSQDSSPESSVHSPDWQPSCNVDKRGHLEDKAVDCRSIDVDEALGLDIDYDDDSTQFKPIGDSFTDDEHVYHELEAFNRFSLLLNDQACTSDSEFGTSSCGSLCSNRNSPLYAQPYPLLKANNIEYDDYPNTAASFTYIPCKNIDRPAPEFHAPPPPPIQSDFDQAEMEFLAELDAQIAELQEKSVAVRQLVEEARERRDAQLRNNQMCMEQIAELRQLKWVMHNNFELVL